MLRPPRRFWGPGRSHAGRWTLLCLLGLPAAAGALCIEGPPVTVRKVEAVVMAHPFLHDEGEDGVALEGASVHLLRKTATGWVEVASAVTDAAGRFRMPAIPPGFYRLRWEDEGFLTAEGELRVRRFTLRRRGTLILWMDRALHEGCGGRLELRRGRVDG